MEFDRTLVLVNTGINHSIDNINNYLYIYTVFEIQDKKQNLYYNFICITTVNIRKYLNPYGSPAGFQVRRVTWRNRIIFQYGL